MADVKDILGINSLPGASPSKGRPRSTKTPYGEEKKPEWMSREVFDLTRGDTATSSTPIAPTLALKAFKERRKVRNKATPWKWKPFTNSARGDDAVFHHWGKAEENPSDYHFAKMNKVLKVQEYTELEYAAHFQDASWSKAETDHLFELAKKYDLRWPVILDRYSDEFPQRSIEDMKDRYFKLQKQLSHLREQAGGPKTPLTNYSYNKEHEVERKKQAEALHHRTKEQLKELEDLLAEYKKIESSQKKKFGVGKRLLTLSDSGALSSSTGTQSSTDTESQKRRKKKSTKKGGIGSPEGIGMSSTPLTPSTPASPSTPRAIFKREQRVSGTSSRGLKVITPLNLAQRTQRLVDQMLDQLGIPTRPMPTAEICRLYNDLRQNIVRVIELESMNKKKLYDLELLKAKRDQLLKERQS